MFARSPNNARWSIWTKRAYDTLKRCYPHTYKAVLTEIDLAIEYQDEIKIGRRDWQTGQLIPG
jgi:hypothetical protein